jgi:hypothetical protein
VLPVSRAPRPNPTIVANAPTIMIGVKAMRMMLASTGEAGTA